MGGGSDILRRAGEALYGERWQSPLSRDLGVTDRTIRNWSAERNDCPDDLWEKLLKLLRDRGERVARLADAIERQLNARAGAPGNGPVAKGDR